jgi:hypothetical protein
MKGGQDRKQAPMTQFVDNILNVPPVLAYVIVACLVFAEDALFVGFVLRERQLPFWAGWSPAAETCSCG